MGLYKIHADKPRNGLGHAYRVDPLVRDEQCGMRRSRFPPQTHGRSAQPPRSGDGLCDLTMSDDARATGVPINPVSNNIRLAAIWWPMCDGVDTLQFADCLMSVLVNFSFFLPSEVPETL